jgi:hypothetical protein
VARPEHEIERIAVEESVDFGREPVRLTEFDPREDIEGREAPSTAIDRLREGSHVERGRAGHVVRMLREGDRRDAEMNRSLTRRLHGPVGRIVGELRVDVAVG